MINSVLQSTEELTLTSTSITLGYQPGNTLPPRTLVVWAASGGTVTLPPIATVLPNFGTVTNYNVGNQSLSITIKSLTGQVISVSSAATTETIETATISSSNAKATWQASLSDLKWYVVA